MNMQHCLSLLAENELLKRIVLSSFELVALGALVWCLARLLRARHPRLTAALLLVVLIKPILGLAAGPLWSVATVEAPKASAPVAHMVSPEVLLPTDSTAAEPEPVSRAMIRQETISKRPLSISWLTIWRGGVLVMVVFHLIQQQRTGMLVRRSRPADTALEARYNALAAELGVRRSVPLRVTDELESPALAFSFRATILIPQWMANQNDASLEWALRHELTHVKHWDDLWHCVRLAARALFFFHPVVWWAGRRWEEAAELACDRAVVQSGEDAYQYADSLYQTLAGIQGRKNRVAVSGLYATRTQIGRRIATLLRQPVSRTAQLGLAGILTVTVFAATALAVGADLAKSENTVADEVREAIAQLSVTAETQTERVQAVFDRIRALPNKEALAETIPWLDSDEPTIRRSAVHIISNLQWDDPSPAFPRLRTLLSHPEALTRGMSALALGAQGDAASFDALVTMLEIDNTAYARRCAAIGLSDLRNPDALPPLRKALKGSDPTVVANASAAISRLEFLEKCTDISGNGQNVVDAIFIVNGSSLQQKERLNQAKKLAETAAPETRQAVYKRALDSESQATRNSAMVLSLLVGDPLELPDGEQPKYDAIRRLMEVLEPTSAPKPVTHEDPLAQYNTHVANHEWVEALTAYDEFLRSVPLGNYRDKKRYNNILQKVSESEKVAFRDAVETHLQQLDGEVDPISTWRCYDILAEMADDPEQSKDYYLKAIDVYPTATYPLPSKHSFLQHLYNNVAMLIATKDCAKAEDYLFASYASDKRFVYIFPRPWEDLYKNAPNKMAAWQQRAAAAYKAKAEKFPELASVLARYPK